MEQNQSFIDKLPRFLRATLRGYKGRICRRDFWLFTAFFYLSIGLLSGIIFAIYKIIPESIIPIAFLFGICFFMLLMLNLLNNIGRMHDLGHSGWLYVALLVASTMIGAVSISASLMGLILSFCVWVYLAFFPPQEESNKWGDNPNHPKAKKNRHL